MQVLPRVGTSSSIQCSEKYLHNDVASMRTQCYVVHHKAQLSWSMNISIKTQH